MFLCHVFVYIRKWYKFQNSTREYITITWDKPSRLLFLTLRKMDYEELREAILASGSEYIDKEFPPSNYSIEPDGDKEYQWLRPKVRAIFDWNRNCIQRFKCSNSKKYVFLDILVYREYIWKSDIVYSVLKLFDL